MRWLNRRPEVATDYAPDPRGTAMFEALTAESARGMSGHTGQVYTGDHGGTEHTFNGDLGHDLQRFTGAAALALYGAAKPVAAAAAQLGDGRNLTDMLNDPALRIFAARATRRSGQ